VKVLKLLKRMTKAMKKFNYTVFMQADDDGISNCHIDMVATGVWVETLEQDGRLFIPYTNIKMIVEDVVET